MLWAVYVILRFIHKGNLGTFHHSFDTTCREDFRTLVPRRLILWSVHLKGTQINEDCMHSFCWYIRKLAENYYLFKYWPNSALLRFQCSNMNRAYRLIHYGGKVKWREMKSYRYVYYRWRYHIMQLLYRFNKSFTR